MANATFPATPAAAAKARRFIAEALLELGLSNQAIEDAVLLTSEAVADTLAHSGMAMNVVVMADESMARVEVHDVPGSAPLVHPSLALSGRGLRVIAAVAEAWGIERCTGHGRCLWFEVRS